MGVFLSADLFLFYMFWEVMLIPMFFLIGIWGHGRKIYSAVKFFVFTISGSLLMLLAIIGIYIVHGRQTAHILFCSRTLYIPRYRRGSRRRCSLGFSWGSQSRCRCSRFIPGFRTPTQTPRRLEASSLPGCF